MAISMFKLGVTSCTHKPNTPNTCFYKINYLVTVVCAAYVIPGLKLAFYKGLVSLGNLTQIYN